MFNFNGNKFTASNYTVFGDRYIFSFNNIAPNQLGKRIVIPKDKLLAWLNNQIK